MTLDIKIGDRISSVKIVSRNGSKAIIDIDGKEFEVDILMVEDGVYSILHQGKSYNIEMIQGDSPKNYFVNTYYTSHEVEVIDAQSRYLKNRKGNADDSTERTISTPMPGKVVRIPVKEGESVAKGDTVIVISAMKMESEYKSPVDGVVKKVHVQEGQTILGNQPLVEIE
jgi:biotin carboxyl carrier protein